MSTLLVVWCLLTPQLYTQVTKSRAALQRMGYKIIDGGMPINVSAIPNKEYREHLPKSGCCGEQELIKLEGFKLTGYKKVVMLDADSVVFKNIDSLIDDPHDVIWTVDRFLGGKCVNGGFLVAKPDPRIYDRMMSWVQEGLFYYGGADVPPWGGSAWNGTNIGCVYAMDDAGDGDGDGLRFACSGTIHCSAMSGRSLHCSQHRHLTVYRWLTM
jgi:hypothetical protein